MYIYKRVQEREKMQVFKTRNMYHGLERPYCYYWDKLSFFLLDLHDILLVVPPEPKDGGEDPAI